MMTLKRLLELVVVLAAGPRCAVHTTEDMEVCEQEECDEVLCLVCTPGGCNCTRDD